MITGLPLDLDLQPLLPMTFVEGLAGRGCRVCSVRRLESQPESLEQTSLSSTTVWTPSPPPLFELRKMVRGQGPNPYKLTLNLGEGMRTLHRYED